MNEDLLHANAAFAWGVAPFAWGVAPVATALWTNASEKKMVVSDAQMHLSRHAQMLHPK